VLLKFFVDDFNAIESTGEQVYTNRFLDSKTIIEKYSYIFEWLQLFDFIIVILAVMILKHNKYGCSI
jgi:lipoprotein-releasing system permease protein